MIQLENYFEFVGSEERDPQSSTIIRIKGHRIGIEHVLAYYREGYAPDEIAEEFPGLELEKIYATITYYLSHYAEVEAYLTRQRERGEQAYEDGPIVHRCWYSACGTSGRKNCKEPGCRIEGHRRVLNR